MWTLSISKSCLGNCRKGFDLTQPVVEVFGLCRRCSAKK